MKDIYIDSTLLSLENRENMAQNTLRRRRFRLRDTNDEDDFIPQLGLVFEASPRQARKLSTRSVLAKEDMEEYEMISSKDFPQSLSTSKRESLAQASPEDLISAAHAPSPATLNDPADEAPGHFYSSQSSHSTPSNLNSYDSSSDLPAEHPPKSSTTNAQSPTPSTTAAIEQSRTRACSLSNAIANLRDLPWHIDCVSHREENNHPIAEYSPSSSFSSAPQETSTPPTYQRNPQRPEQQITQDTTSTNTSTSTSTNTSRISSTSLVRISRQDQTEPQCGESTISFLSETMYLPRSPIDRIYATPGFCAAADLVFSAEASGLGDSWMSVLAQPACVGVLR